MHIFNFILWTIRKHNLPLYFIYLHTHISIYNTAYIFLDTVIHIYISLFIFIFIILSYIPDTVYILPFTFFSLKYCHNFALFDCYKHIFLLFYSSVHLYIVICYLLFFFIIGKCPLRISLYLYLYSYNDNKGFLFFLFYAYTYTH